MSSQFFSTIFISSEHCSTFLISWKLFSTHPSSRKLLLSERSSSTQKPLHAESFCTEKLLHTDVFTHGETITHRKLLYTHGNLLQTEAISKRSFLHRVRCGTEWQQNAQSTSKYYLALQSLHKWLPSIQDTHKVCPSTTIYIYTITNCFFFFGLWQPTHVHISCGAVCQTFFSKDQFWQFVMHPGRSVLIGRGSDCDVTLPYRGVSVHHALLRYRPVGISGSLLVQNHNLTCQSHQTIEKKAVPCNFSWVLFFLSFPWQCSYIHNIHKIKAFFKAIGWLWAGDALGRHLHQRHWHGLRTRLASDSERPSPGLEGTRKVRGSLQPEASSRSSPWESLEIFGHLWNTLWYTNIAIENHNF